MIWRLVAVLMLYHAGSASTQRAVILSGPSSVNATLNSTVEFNCNITGIFVDWLINGADEDTPNLKDRVRSIDDKQQIGGQEVIVSNFYVPATIDFNNSRIQCKIAGSDRVRTSRAAIFRIQGLLDAPSASITVGDVNNTHKLEWIPPFTLDTDEIEDITHYSVCTNISESLDFPHNQTSFQFPSICEPFEFKISAFNVLGRGDSTVVIFSATSNSVVKITAGSVKTEVFFITRNKTGLKIILSSMEGGCFELSRLEVMEVDDGGVAIVPRDVGYIFPTVGTSETIVLTAPVGLPADRKYRAFLNITTVTDGIEFTTFDVQAVYVVFHQQLREVEITCEFARGSLSRGCKIEVSYSTRNETRYALRNRDSAFHFPDTVSNSFALSVNGLYCVSVYDIEADGTTSSLQVYHNCSNVTLLSTPEGSTMSSVMTPSALPEPGSSTKTRVIFAVTLPIGTVLVGVIGIVIMTVIFKKWKDSHRKTNTENLDMQNKNTSLNNIYS